MSYAPLLEGFISKNAQKQVPALSSLSELLESGDPTVHTNFPWFIVIRCCIDDGRISARIIAYKLLRFCRCQHVDWQVAFKNIVADIANDDSQLRCAALRALRFIPPSIFFLEKNALLDNLLALPANTSEDILAEIVSVVGAMIFVDTVMKNNEFCLSLWKYLCEVCAVNAEAFGIVAKLFRKVLEFPQYESVGHKQAADLQIDACKPYAEYVRGILTPDIDKLLHAVDKWSPEDLAKCIFPLAYLAMMKKSSAEIEPFLLKWMDSINPTVLLESASAAIMVNSFWACKDESEGDREILSVFPEQSNTVVTKAIVTLTNLIGAFPPETPILEGENAVDAIKWLMVVLPFMSAEICAASLPEIMMTTLSLTDATTRNNMLQYIFATLIYRGNKHMVTSGPLIMNALFRDARLSAFYKGIKSRTITSDLWAMLMGTFNRIENFNTRCHFVDGIFEEGRKLVENSGTESSKTLNDFLHLLLKMIVQSFQEEDQEAVGILKKRLMEMLLEHIPPMLESLAESIDISRSGSCALFLTFMGLAVVDNEHLQKSDFEKLIDAIDKYFFHTPTLCDYKLQREASLSSLGDDALPYDQDILKPLNLELSLCCVQMICVHLLDVEDAAGLLEKVHDGLEVLSYTLETIEPESLKIVQDASAFIKGLSKENAASWKDAMLPIVTEQLAKNFPRAPKDDKTLLIEKALETSLGYPGGISPVKPERKFMRVSGESDAYRVSMTHFVDSNSKTIHLTVVVENATAVPQSGGYIVIECPMGVVPLGQTDFGSEVSGICESFNDTILALDPHKEQVFTFVGKISSFEHLVFAPKIYPFLDKFASCGKRVPMVYDRPILTHDNEFVRAKPTKEYVETVRGIRAQEKKLKLDDSDIFTSIDARHALPEFTLLMYEVDPMELCSAFAFAGEHGFDNVFSQMPTSEVVELSIPKLCGCEKECRCLKDRIVANSVNTPVAFVPEDDALAANRLKLSFISWFGEAFCVLVEVSSEDGNDCLKIDLRTDAEEPLLVILNKFDLFLDKLLGKSVVDALINTQ